MPAPTLDARSRPVLGRHVRGLRREGVIPAVVYGHRVEPRSIAVDERALERMWRASGRSHLIGLSVDGGRPTQVLFREYQVHPRTARPLHADFLAVNLRERIAVDVPVVVTGEAPAIAQRLGQLLQTVTALRAECLPADLPPQINVDVSHLVAVDDSITVGQLSLPSGVTILADPGELVVKVAPLRVQEVEEPAAEEAGPEPAEAEASAEGGEGAGEAETTSPG